MKFDNASVYNFDNAIRGMRLPMNSGDKSDSYWIEYPDYYKIGDNDLDLMQRLVKAGTPHDKFMRQIFVSVDITAPLTWWKQMDQYKVGTTTNSQSSMHRISSKPITLDCFETTDYEEISFGVGEILSPHMIIEYCEKLRKKYLETKDKKYWRELVRWLPESWLQTRTWTANYEVIRNICHQRKGHKLSEWKAFIDWAHTLPYAEELIFVEDNNGTESKED